MVTADLSSLAYFAPIAAFLMVFLVSYAIFAKTKIFGDSKWLNLFVAFIISTLFISVSGVRFYVQTVVPWVAVLFVTLVFILALTGFIGKPAENLNRGIGITFIFLFGAIFLVSAMFVFSNLLVRFIPGPAFGEGLEPSQFYVLDWLYSPGIAGAILLVVISAIVSWVLVKAK